MRKILTSFLVVIFLFSLVRPEEARAEMPVKAKAFLTIVGYGVAGGALLGVASLAFGTSTRAVAQGASLGLYAGILFGSYVLFAHHQKRYGNYEDDNSPYQQSNDVYSDGYQQDEGGSGDSEAPRRGGFFDRVQVMQDHMHQQSFTFDSQKRRGGQLPPLQLNIIQYNF